MPVFPWLLKENWIMKLEQALEAILEPDRRIEEEAWRRQRRLTKPDGSLGRLEEIACHIAGITGKVRPDISRKRIVVFAADHGVSCAGVSAYPRAVTSQMVLNFLKGGAAINAIAGAVGAEVEVVDIGVDDDRHGFKGLISRKIRKGTSNLAEGPAMDRREAVEAMEVGIESAIRARDDGIGILGTGDMGIGNSTSSAALFAAYLGLPASEVTGRGTGVDDVRMKRKVRVVEQALEANRDKLTDPLSTLAALGGFEIAGLSGLILGAAASRIPVVVDGFISTAAALAAIRIKPAVQAYCFFAHLSAESGHRHFFAASCETPLLDLGLRLGEGTGAALAMGIMEAAVRMHNEMATFEDAGVEDRTVS